MTVSYPLTIPASGGPIQYTWHNPCTTGRSMSPYTFDSQVQEYEGAMWAVDISLAPMERSVAEPWICFLLMLHSSKGTFLFGDPKATVPQGIATGTPLVKGGSQTGQSLVTDGWTASQTGILKAGDWMQIDNRLYKNLQDVNSDGSGDATFDIFPPLRESPTDNTAIDVTSAKGLFRLADGNSQLYAVDAKGAFLVSFSALEAV